MSSLPTSRLRLPKQATGDNPNAWGPVLNGLFDLVDDSQGSVAVTVNGNVTLTNDNYVANQARFAGLRLQGTGLAGNAPALVAIPAVDKWRIVRNDCAGDVTIGTGVGLAATVRAGTMAVVLCDGTDAFVIDPTLDQIRKPAADLDMNGRRGTNAANGVNPSDIATVGQTVPAQASLAKAWATQPSGEVVPGQGYSAFFWAAQAKVSADAAAQFNPAAYPTRDESLATAHALVLAR